MKKPSRKKKKSRQESKKPELVGRFGETKADLATKSLKFDGGKLDWSLMPTASIEGGIRAFMYGEKKYARWNWATTGIAYSRLFAGLMRHMWAWYWRKDYDDESGLHHLDHAQACLSMLREMVDARPALDDRPNA